MSKGGISGLARLARREEGQAAAQREEEWESRADHLAGKRQIQLSSCPFTATRQDRTEKKCGDAPEPKPASQQSIHMHSTRLPGARFREPSRRHEGGVNFLHKRSQPIRYKNSI